MSDEQEFLEVPAFKDRKVGLIIFGILHIISGCLCALMVAMMVLVAIISSAGQNAFGEFPNIRMMIPGTMVYVVLGTWFIWMGIGVIMARRWARALMLVSSWIWLISGTFGLVFILLLMPNMYDQMGEDDQMPKEFVTIFKFVMIAFMAFIYVVVPAVLVLFYGSKNVKVTCNNRDPQQRWTDKCPLPVLAVSMIFAGWAASLLLMGCYNWAIPFFGTILTGLPGATVILIVMSLSAYTAWGTYKLDINSWWCALLLTVVWFSSVAVTFSLTNIMDLYSMMDLPPQQLEIMEQYNMPNSSAMTAAFVLPAAALVAFLIYIKKYFKSQNAEQPSACMPG